MLTRTGLVQVNQVKRYPDQERPSLGYATAAGFVWKTDKRTELRDVWQNAPEGVSMGDPDEVNLADPNKSIFVRQKTISGESLEEVAEQAIAYTYKHKVEGLRIDTELIDGLYTFGSFPYRYNGELYAGTVLVERKNNKYVYNQLDFTPAMTDEGETLPFVPGSGSMSMGSGEDFSLAWMGGEVFDSRIRRIDIHGEDEGIRSIPIEADQSAYRIQEELGTDLKYVEARDENDKVLYTWQF
ncbi:hypothetical protein QWJ34_10350 [Saccharibacillus sp. CPCC 101409]|uniref:hypothetical protein n=1 Tax=Saccharibacillus sp. CPCC 101409 TaxID=3058041 RepID=UPI002672E4C6|nr:hypothetical protein [Saccharibacillus sp. CPCC 101409]MDO3410162.1 hypothetical protein [Saccharibacillus sp. CPCC 101409]